MYVALIILVLFLLFLFVPIKAVLKKNDFYVQILFIKYRKAKKKPEKQKKSQQSVTKKNTISYVKKIISYSEDIKKLAEYIADKCLTFEDISLAMDFGTGDAAQTGILTGALNGVVYTILSVLHHKTTVKKWDIKITPDFEREKFDIQYLCIVRVRIIHIISIGLKALKLYKKLKKN